MEEKLEQKLAGVSGLVSDTLSRVKHILGNYAYWNKGGKVSYAGANVASCYGGSCSCTACSCAESTCHGDDSCGGDV